jgi:hypothetical protein
VSISDANSDQAASRNQGGAALNGEATRAEAGDVAAQAAVDIRGNAAELFTWTVSATRSFHHELLADASKSLSAGHSEMAVVLAQAAAEQCMEWVMNAFLRARGNEPERAACAPA